MRLHRWVFAAADAVLPTLDGSTKLIPGHGPLATKAELQKYRDAMAAIRDRVKALIGAAKPTAQWDPAWGGGFFKPDDFVGMVYRSLGGKLPPPPK